MAHETDRDKILAAATADFRSLHQELGRRIQQVFPEAEPVAAGGMAAWHIPLPEPPAGPHGTMPYDVVTIGPVERVAGVTIHFWHPKDPALLDQHAARLKAAGFKPMVGCVQWNRKAPFPLEEFDRLLVAAKEAM